MKLQLSFFLLFFIPFIGLAQTGTIRGFVYEEGSGEPVIFTNVYLLGTTYGVATDVNGFFSITKVPAGEYTLTVTYIGFETLSLPISLKSGAIVTEKLFLSKSSIKLEDVVVSAERQEMKKAIHTSIVKISPKQIEKLPSIGGQPDLAQYLQVVPGVVFTGDQGGQLYIRGGSPVQNKVILDGMIIYNPFHTIGLFSVFDQEIIRNADVYTGGFNADYGGRISSIMDITTRDGNKKNISGKATLNTFGGGMILEGPLKKQKEISQKATTVSYIVSGKTSFLDKTSDNLYSYVSDEGLPFTYTDMYGKISINAANGSKINFFGFNYNDKVSNYQNVKDLHWDQYGMGTNFVIIPATSTVMIKSNIAYSSYKIDLTTMEQKPRSSLIKGFNFGLSFINFIGDNELDYGMEILGFKTDFAYKNILNQSITQQENTSEIAVFAKYRMNISNLIIEPGIRFQYYASLAEPSVEPRFGMKYKITEKLRLKASGGLYSQNLISAQSNRDVVNLFTGFISGPENIQNEFDGEKVDTRLQKSAHLVGGFEYDFSNRLTLNIEGYYKNNYMTTLMNRNKIFEDSYEYSRVPDILKKDFVVEKGKAYGIDLLLKYDYRNIYLWMVYSVGIVKNTAEFINNENEVTIREYYPYFDRRHNLNLVGTYSFGEDLVWEFSARWNFGSGFPFTKSKGYYENIPINDIHFNIPSSSGQFGVIYSDINTGRLPDYHRLDLTIKRMWFFGANSKLEAAFSLTNVYDRNNIFYFDRIRHDRVDQLPIMPSIGINFSF